MDESRRERYLHRIGLQGPLRADFETLALMQRSHMTAVPFENLHVFYRRGVDTAIEWSIPKIVDRRRGGWCFELNGAFAALLDSLGYSVMRLSAGVMLSGEPPDEPDHLTLRVDLDEAYLVDVGFGDSFERPLRLASREPQDGGHARYRFSDAEGYVVLEVEESGEWLPCYRFGQEAMTTADFTPRSNQLQTEPGLRWTEVPFATRLLAGGSDRVWLLHDRLKLRRNGVISESPVSKNEWAETLEEWFNMTP